MGGQELTYVYRLEDPTNGMAYIGSRYKAGLTSVVDDDAYRGSVTSEMWKDEWPEISKRCEKTIIDVFTTKEEALELEMKLHALYKVDTNPRFYNRARDSGGAIHYPPPEGVSDATKARTSAALTGKVLSEEHRAAISAGNTGKKKGPISEEHRANLSAAAKIAQNRPEVKARQYAAAKGQKRSEETKANMSAAQLLRWANANKSVHKDNEDEDKESRPLRSNNTV